MFNIVLLVCAGHYSSFMKQRRAKYSKLWHIIPRNYSYSDYL